MHPYFGRTELLIGAAGLRRLRAARVAVFGMGGVGSYAVEALARSGIGYLRLVDFDRVGPSN
ncbi:MAG TPA: ThiF family adenylyltransferase, partial [Armatimonadota bacterium]|nr:ThiF family adenylyltransferase [Armatimonadota bacterium]